MAKTKFNGGIAYSRYIIHTGRTGYINRLLCDVHETWCI